MNFALSRPGRFIGALTADLRTVGYRLAAALLICVILTVAAMPSSPPTTC